MNASTSNYFFVEVKRDRIKIADTRNHIIFPWCKMILEIIVTDNVPFIHLVEDKNRRENSNCNRYYYYRVSADLIRLIRNWEDIDLSQDGLCSGILADYLEENMPQDKVILSLIERMRQRFNSPFHNQSTGDIKRLI